MANSATASTNGPPAEASEGTSADRYNPTMSTRYPRVRRALLDAIRVKRGDNSLAQTVAIACDEMIARHFGEEALQGGDEE